MTRLTVTSLAIAWLGVGPLQAQVPPDADALISIDVTDAPMAEVMATIAKQVGAKIVVAEDVEARVTERFRDISWRLAVDLIAKTYRCEVQEREGVIHLRRLATNANDLGVRITRRLTAKPALILELTDAKARALAEARDREPAIPGNLPLWKLRLLPADTLWLPPHELGIVELGGVVCVPDPSGVIGVEVTTGARLWAWNAGWSRIPNDVGSPAEISVRCAVWKGQVLVPTRADDGFAYLCRLDPCSGEELGRIRLGRLATPPALDVGEGEAFVSTRFSFGRVDLERGRVLYLKELLRSGPVGVAVGPKHVAVVGERHLTLYRRSDGGEAWRWQRASRADFQDICPRPAVTEDSVYAASWERGAWRVVRLDVKTGAPQGAHVQGSTAAEDSVVSLRYAGDTLYVLHRVRGRRYLSALDPTQPTLRWCRAAGLAYGAPPSVYQGRVYLTDNEAHQVRVVGGLDGDQQDVLWLGLGGEEVDTAPVVNEDAVYVLRESGVLERHLRLKLRREGK